MGGFSRLSLFREIWRYLPATIGDSALSRQKNTSMVLDLIINSIVRESLATRDRYKIGRLTLTVLASRLDYYDSLFADSSIIFYPARDSALMS